MCAIATGAWPAWPVHGAREWQFMTQSGLERPPLAVRRLP